MGDDVFWIDTGMASKDVRDELDDQFDLFRVVIEKLAANFRSARFATGILGDATRPVHDLDSDGTAVQCRLAPPVALSGMPGALIVADEPVHPEPPARIAGIAVFRHQVMRADGPVRAFGQHAQRFGEVDAGEMNDEVADAAALVFRNGVDEAQRRAGKQRARGQDRGE